MFLKFLLFFFRECFDGRHNAQGEEGVPHLTRKGEMGCICLNM